MFNIARFEKLRNINRNSPANNNAFGYLNKSAQNE